MKDWVIKYTKEGLSVYLDNVIEATLTRNTGNKGNVLEILINNYNSSAISGGTVVFEESENITVYAKDGIIDLNNPENIIGTFVIKDIDYFPDTHTLKLICADKTFELLSKIYVLKDTPDQPIDSRVFNIIQTINSDGNTQNPITTHIDTTRSNGSVFPSVKYTSLFKTAYEALDELSQPEATGDNLPYVYWFDENDEFYWQYPDNTVQSMLLNYGESPIKEMKPKKNNSEVISMVIYNTGTDIDGATIMFYYNDPNNPSSKGRIKYFPMLDISRDIKDLYKEEITAGTLTNEDFRILAKGLAESRAQTLITAYGRGVFEVETRVEGGIYNVGKIYNTHAKEIGFTALNMRLVTVSHTFNKNGWESKLTLKEDIDTLNNL